MFSNIRNVSNIYLCILYNVKCLYNVLTENLGTSPSAAATDNLRVKFRLNDAPRPAAGSVGVNLSLDTGGLQDIMCTLSYNKVLSYKK